MDPIFTPKFIAIKEVSFFIDITFNPFCKIVTFVSNKPLIIISPLNYVNSA